MSSIRFEGVKITTFVKDERGGQREEAICIYLYITFFLNFLHFCSHTLIVSLTYKSNCVLIIKRQLNLDLTILFLSLPNNLSCICTRPSTLDFPLKSSRNLAKALVGQGKGELNFLLCKIYWEGPRFTGFQPSEVGLMAMGPRILYFCKAFQGTWWSVTFGDHWPDDS